MQKVGKITHFFGNLSVAVIELEGEIIAGDEIHIKGHTTNFTMKVDSMQIDHKEVEKAGAGQSIGMKVPDAVRQNDEVFLVKS